jgi:hypothetical protein
VDYLNQWRAIEARIRGLVAAAHLHAALLQVRASDTYRRGSYLGIQALDVLNSIIAFVAQFRGSLPPAATQAIDKFIAERKGLFEEAGGTPDVRDERNRAVVVLLAGLETQISFLLHDIQPTIKARSELAFAHLARSIAADADIRLKWQTGYEAGERQCEALGANHLLLHGLFAFKVSAAGAQTDLVYQDAPPADLEYVQGLVLTEWKKASKGQIRNAFAEARQQAQLYVPGPFSGNELVNYRYLVVVSDEPGAVPQDEQANGIVYRHILLPVNPTVPSKLARQMRRRS